VAAVAKRVRFIIDFSPSFSLGPMSSYEEQSPIMDVFQEATSGILLKHRANFDITLFPFLSDLKP
jgi:hypothetical protein